MTIDLNSTAQFSIQGVRFQRNNPDGTIAEPSRSVSKTPGFNVEAFSGASYVVNMKFKVDNETEVSADIDFTPAVDKADVQQMKLLQQSIWYLLLPTYSPSCLEIAFEI